jgi:DNA-binding GntR family transcriptional regulator
VCQDIEDRKRPGGDLRQILEAAGKFPLQLMKLCGINWAMEACMMEQEPTLLITEEHVTRASAQLEYFIAQEHKLYDALAQAPADALATKLRGWCKTRRGQMMTSYNMRKSASRNAPIAVFHEALDILEDEGVVRVETLKTAGRPSIRVHIL